jgi:D-serine deaminase-like pyridoxal phosphate-dependent protein
MPLFIHELETPIPVVDLVRMAANLDTMAAYCAVHGLALRPHVKTHKASRVAAEQMRLGAVGLTCATPRELEVMSEVSHDLLLAHPPIGWSKLHRVVNVTREVRLSVAVDTAEAATRLAQVARDAGRFIGARVEVDLGMRRMGAPTPEAALELVEHVAGLTGLRYEGILFYPGHIRQPVREQDAAIAQLRADLGRVLEVLGDADLAPPIVSGGSTPLGWRIHEVEGVTEVRPGTYVFNDRTTAEIGACGWEDCALTVLATVISTAVPGQAVIDAGSKALGREPLAGPDAAAKGFGALLDRPEVTVARLSEEHGILDLSRTSWRPEVGEVVRVVPNHVCIVVHLNDLVYGVRGEMVETHWPVTARGREMAGPVLAR